MIDALFRRLPSFKGKRKLANLFTRRDIPFHQDITIKGKYGCSFLLPNIKENIGFEVFVNGVYEKKTIRFIAGKIPLNGRMIDIGANIGTIVIPVCKLRPDISAIAIEASPRVFKYLRSNKETNGLNNCIVINRAILDRDAEEIKFYSPVEQFGIGMIEPEFTTESEVTISQTLSSLLKEHSIGKVDLIKIDIEGYEYFAFKGAAELLTRDDAPMIVFEFAAWAEELVKDIKPGDAQELLMKYGYDLYQVDDKENMTRLSAPMKNGMSMLLAIKQKNKC